MKLSINLFLAILLLTALASAQPSSPNRTKGGIHIIANTELVSDLIVGQKQDRITGRTSLYFVTSERDLKEGRIFVQSLNVPFFGVSQLLLAGDTMVKKPLGLLAFGIVADEKQELDYSTEGGRSIISGKLQMFADASFLSERSITPKDPEEHTELTPVIDTRAEVRLDLFDSLSTSPDDGFQTISGKLKLEFITDQYVIGESVVPALKVITNKTGLEFEIGDMFQINIGHRLCIQPVRLFKIDWFPRGTNGEFSFPTPQLTGAGLPYGEPAAHAEWEKANVMLDIRSWITLGGSDTHKFWNLQYGDRYDLLNRVSDPNCIEVFFVENINIDCSWGGGFTIGEGTATAKIITSDRNALTADNLTHLAHELGHVMGLRHPSDPPTSTARPASTGTLMCPSGCMADNPSINSTDNKLNLSNPLFDYTIMPPTPGPDCDDSADCGPCP